MHTYTIEDEIKEIRRELAMREGYYPRAVAARKMTQPQADRQINLMKSVLRRVELLHANTLQTTLDAAKQTALL